jgi:hypothetical protein
VQSRWIALGFLAILVALTNAMTPKRIGELRQETISMFYHGFDNYMNIAFPEDEVGSFKRYRNSATDFLKSLGQFPAFP